MSGRCKTTRKVIYKSKRAADGALRKVQAVHSAAEAQHAYRCEDSPSHWHLGSTGNIPTSDNIPTGINVHRIERWTFAQWEVATMTLWARCRDYCEWCGKPLGGQMERHHRQPRAVGGDRLANLLALHPGCHQHVTEHPTEARDRGVIVSRHAADPATVEVTLPDDRRVFLDDEGRYSTP